jgi:DNA primase
MLRRLMMDDSFFRGELIYVFDGDEAGKAAALKAFGGEQHLAGQSFVAVAPDGMDPCDLRLASGDGALRDLVARRTPLFEFVIRAALSEVDLDSAEGRVAALRRCVPMVAQIKDPTLRDEYARQLAGWVGWSDVAQVLGRVREEAKNPTSQSRAKPRRAGAAEADSGAAEFTALRPDPRDPTLWPQREALKSALQYELGVETIRVNDDDKLPRYIASVLARLQEVWVGRQIAEVKSKLQRMSPVEQGDEYHALFGDLVAMEAYRRSLLQQASGDDLTA